MVKSEKLMLKVLQNRPISYNEAERILKKLGFEVIACGSHHVFRKKGYSKNISIKKRAELFPYQIRERYRNELKNWIFGCAKATQFIDHRWPHIINIRLSMIGKFRQLSRCPKPIFEFISV